MAQVNGLNGGLNKRQVSAIIAVALVTAVGIWLSVLLQTIGLRTDMETRKDANAVCVAISQSYNIQIRRQQADTLASELDSLPLLRCTTLEEPQ